MVIFFFFFFFFFFPGSFFLLVPFFFISLSIFSLSFKTCDRDIKRNPSGNNSLTISFLGLVYLFAHSYNRKDFYLIIYTQLYGLK